MKEDILLNNYHFTSDSDEIEALDWANYVSSHPGGSIFQSPEMSEFYSLVDGHISCNSFCLDKKGKIVGMVCAVVISGRSLLSKALTSRAVISGGPLVDKGLEPIIPLLLNTLNSAMPPGVVYIQIRNHFNTEDTHSEFLGAGYTFDQHLDILFDLNKGKETLWAELHPTRRKQIRRSMRRDVSTIIYDNPDEEKLEFCYNMLRGTYKKARLPLPGIKFFKTAFGVFTKGGHLKCIAALLNERIIGFRFFFVYNGLIYDWYASSDSQYNDRYPNDILPWGIIEWGVDNLHKVFDFGGAGHPDKDYGVKDYKKKFGGKVVNYGRYLLVRSQIKYQAGRFAINVVRRKKRV